LNAGRQFPLLRLDRRICQNTRTGHCWLLPRLFQDHR
jgi:hypothetical protein